jgi:predicted nucleotidyltransferase
MMNPFYKETLNSNFWNREKFDNKVRNKILKIVDNFVKESEMNIPVLDVRLTGSLANYTYNKYSDLDIHIVTHFQEINKDKKIVKDALDGKRFVWNLRHNIFIRGHEIELYFEDKDEEHIASGIYSLKNDTWVRKPKYNPPGGIDVGELKEKETFYTDLVNRLYQRLGETAQKDELKLIHNKAKKIKDKIVKIRGEALKNEGEFALENLLFKKLRNTGIIERIINVINLSYDKFFMESLTFNKTLNKVLSHIH